MLFFLSYFLKLFKKHFSYYSLKDYNLLFFISSKNQQCFLYYAEMLSAMVYLIDYFES